MKSSDWQGNITLLERSSTVGEITIRSSVDRGQLLSCSLGTVRHYTPVRLIFVDINRGRRMDFYGIMDFVRVQLLSQNVSNNLCFVQKYSSIPETR